MQVHLYLSLQTLIPLFLIPLFSHVTHKSTCGRASLACHNFYWLTDWLIDKSLQYPYTYKYNNTWLCISSMQPRYSRTSHAFTSSHHNLLVYRGKLIIICFSRRRSLVPPSLNPPMSIYSWLEERERVAYSVWWAVEVGYMEEDDRVARDDVGDTVAAFGDGPKPTSGRDQAMQGCDCSLFSLRPFCRSFIL